MVFGQQASPRLGGEEAAGKNQPAALELDASPELSICEGQIRSPREAAGKRYPAELELDAPPAPPGCGGLWKAAGQPGIDCHGGSSSTGAGPTAEGSACSPNDRVDSMFPAESSAVASPDVLAVSDDMEIVEDDEEEGMAGLEVIADSESDSKPSDLMALAAEARFSLEAGMEMIRSRQGSQQASRSASKEAFDKAMGAVAAAEEAALPPMLQDDGPELLPLTPGRSLPLASKLAKLPPLGPQTPAPPPLSGGNALRGPPVLAPLPRLPPKGAPVMPTRPPGTPPLLGAGSGLERPQPPSTAPPMMVPPPIPSLPDELRFTADAAVAADLGRGPISPVRKYDGSPASGIPLRPEKSATTESVVAAAAAVKAAATEAAETMTNQGLHQRRPRAPSKGSTGSRATQGSTGTLSTKPAAAMMGTLEQYAVYIVRFPVCLLSSYLLLVLAVLVVGGIFKFPNFEIEEDFSTFIRADGMAMRNREAFIAALGERQAIDERRRLAGDGGGTGGLPTKRPRLQAEGAVLRKRKERRLAHAEDGSSPERRLRTTFYLMQSLTIVYPEGPGAFPNLESDLVALPGYRRICESVREEFRVWCYIGESFPAFTHPSEHTNATPGIVFEFDFDKKGEEVPLSFTMTYLEESTAVFNPGEMETVALTDFRRYFPRDYKPPAPYGPDAFSEPGSRPSATKSRFSFQFMVGDDSMSATDVRQGIDEAIQKYEDAVVDTIWPFLVEQSELGQLEGRGPIYYYGDRINGHEITQVLYGDITFALGSGVFVALYMRLHTRSFLLTFACGMLILVSVPLAYILAPMGKVNVASFLSIFLLTGIGSDVIFVFTDFWDQSAFKSSMPHERLSWTIAHAGRSCLATSITTAASFFANLGSALQTLREFGLFMGLCVMNVFFLVLLILPPILFLIDRRQSCGTEGFADPSSARVADLGSVDISAGQHAALTDEGGGSHARFPRSASKLRCNGRTSATDRDGLVFSRRQLLKLTVLVSQSPKAVLVFTFLTVCVFAIGVAASIEMQTTAPQIFPADHNQVKALEWSEQFVHTDVPERDDDGMMTPLKAHACVPYAGMQNQPALERCGLYWCDAMPTPSEATASESVFEPTSVGSGPDAETGSGGGEGNGGSNDLHVAACFLGSPHVASGSSTELSSCSEAWVHMRLMALEEPENWASSQTWYDLLRTHFGRNLVTTVSRHVAALPFVALEDWSTGTISTSRFFSMGLAALPHMGGEEACTIDAICAVGQQVCQTPENWTYVGDISVKLRAPEPRLRRLQSSSPLVPVASQINVAVVWGLRPALYTPRVGSLEEVWSYDPNFQPSNPWAQRAMLAFCTHPWVQPGGELDVVSETCWVTSFRDLQREAGRKFPSRDFTDDISLWWDAEPLLGTENIWFSDGQFAATKMEFKVISLVIFVGYSIDFSLHIAHSFGEVDPMDPELLELEAITRNRRNRHELSKKTGNGAAIAVHGGASGVGIGGRVGGGMGNDGRAQRPDTFLPAKPEHMAIDMSPADVRIARVRTAVLRLGGATLSSAVSTVGSNIFLLLCTMNIFVKLGAVVIAVTVVSIYFALVVLPAALMLVGPPHGPWFAKWVMSKVGKLCCGAKDKLDEEIDSADGGGVWSPSGDVGSLSGFERPMSPFAEACSGSFGDSANPLPPEWAAGFDKPEGHAVGLPVAEEGTQGSAPPDDAFKEHSGADVAMERSCREYSADCDRGHSVGDGAAGVAGKGDGEDDDRQALLEARFP